MIVESDYTNRGWDVSAVFEDGNKDLAEVLNKMYNTPESRGKSSVGTRNMLYSLIVSIKPKTVLEVGAHIGTAALVMGQALKRNGFGKLYSLEPQDHYFDLITRYISEADLSDYVIPLKKLSTDSSLFDIVNDPADLIFLDANHSYTAALTDINICTQMLSDKGLIVLDDVAYPHSNDIDPEKNGGVRQAIIDFCASNPAFTALFLEHPLWLNPCGIAFLSRNISD